jgi:hypothetical protein
VGLFRTIGPKLSKLARKYRPLVPVLRELILRPDTPLDSGVKQMITGQLANAEDRLAAVCHDHDADSGPGWPFRPTRLFLTAARRACLEPTARPW